MESKTTTESSDRRFALLIDADNVSARYLKPILNELSKYGTVTIKRIYGDWTLTLHAKWKDALLENSITPIQQFGYTQGKNATDSAMIIDAMDILYTDNVDGFCLVSSDSDFTRLASRLRESGRMVIGMGEKKTPPFRRVPAMCSPRSRPLCRTSATRRAAAATRYRRTPWSRRWWTSSPTTRTTLRPPAGEIGSRAEALSRFRTCAATARTCFSEAARGSSRGCASPKDHSSVTVELAEGGERTEKAVEKPERAGSLGEGREGREGR